MQNGDVAVVVMNWRGIERINFELDFTQLGMMVPSVLPKGVGIKVRDLWKHEDVATVTGTTTYEVSHLPPHGTQMFRLTIVKVEEAL
jgi:hypothetical protein